MKRPLLVTAIVIVVLVTAALIPVTEKDYIVLQAPLNNTLHAVQELKYWQQWHPDMPADTAGIQVSGERLTAGRLTVEVITTTPFGILVKQSLNGDESIYSLSVKPSDDPNLSRVEIRFGTRLLRLIWDEIVNFLPTGPNRLLLALNRYLTDTKAFYGFPIEYTPVTDTLVITVDGSANTRFIKDSITNYLQTLRTFAADSRLIITDSPMAYIQRTEQPVKNLMAGLPVNREVPVKSPIEYQRMPQGRMVTIDFKGPYSQIQDAYRAGDRFINDYNLKTVALPYERYYSISDSTRAHVKIFIPIL